MIINPMIINSIIINLMIFIFKIIFILVIFCLLFIIIGLLWYIVFHIFFKKYEIVQEILNLKK
jgi:hypothetical protein